MPQKYCVYVAGFESVLKMNITQSLLISFNIHVHIFSEINSKINKNYTSVMIELFR